MNTGKRLKKELTLREVFTLVFGNIIGVGWIIVGANWILEGGTLGAMLAFLIAAVALLPVALCYAELGAMYPLSGGEVVYTYEAFGPRMAFASGWFLAFGFVAIALFETVAIGWLITILIPAFKGPTAYEVMGYQISWGAIIVSICGILLITTVNYYGGRSAGRFQYFMTWLLLFFCLAFVAAGIFKGDVANLFPLFRGADNGGALKGLFLVLITTPFWYSGFNSMPQAIGEVAELKDPVMLAKIVASTFIAGGVFYASVILATAFAAPRWVLVNAEMGVATAMEYAFNSFWMGKLVLIAGLLGLLTTWNAVFYSATRVLFALGRAKLIFPAMTRTHPTHGSPHIAVLTVGILSIGGCLAGRPALLVAINNAALCFSLVYLFACCAFMKIRQRYPGLKRPYKMPGYPWLVIIAIIVCSVMVICSLYFTWIERQTLVPVEWVLMLFWILAGILAWAGSGRVRGEVSEAERRTLIHTR